MDTLKGALEKQKVDAEQKIAELSSSNSELSSKLAVYTEETERGQSALQLYREQVTLILWSFPVKIPLFARLTCWILGLQILGRRLFEFTFRLLITAPQLEG